MTFSIKSFFVHITNKFPTFSVLGKKTSSESLVCRIRHLFPSQRVDETHPSPPFPFRNFCLCLFASSASSFVLGFCCVTSSSLPPPLAFFLIVATIAIVVLAMYLYLKEVEVLQDAREPCVFPERQAKNNLIICEDYFPSVSIEEDKQYILATKDSEINDLRSQLTATREKEARLIQTNQELVKSLKKKTQDLENKNSIVEYLMQDPDAEEYKKKKKKTCQDEFIRRVLGEMPTTYKEFLDRATRRQISLGSCEFGSCECRITKEEVDKALQAFPCEVSKFFETPRDELCMFKTVKLNLSKNEEDKIDTLMLQGISHCLCYRSADSREQYFYKIKGIFTNIFNIIASEPSHSASL